MIWLRYAYVALALFLATVILSPLQIIALWRGWTLARKMPRYWHMVACFVLGIRIHVHGAIETRRPLMLSANHTSWLDIIVLGRVADVAFIAKSEVRSWPIFGVFARLQNSVFIERADKRGTGRQVNSIAERMAAGEIIILFPEGTTSDGNRLLPLKYSLFGAASSAVPYSPDGTVHVQPVAVAYTGIQGMPMGRFMRPVVAWPGDVGMLPSLAGVIRARALDVDVCFGESVTFTADTKRKEAAAEVEGRMRTLLADRLSGR
ncbi:1-acyl-sn-glycerol-3-phosphate acyltransferase [Martelella lutilitoris]|uniref:1-acyl-sn-glycerol-3-phosphate acyltransferase n=1 Tax=Martelella lutilitoris TaxID=2583532 RepID=A0A5C4JKS9_9HYPH|nr:1-acyl-sn-glycerol-3-phosphate acyltransferase [Martelella lutilitoris]TNB46116.1 1-acyl-sn-glycerol-3-phosphate acyltransferase [Martelella lutilitoris]